jgi:predicted ATPase
LLLLLDNCEQVASACGDAAVRLLARCPALVVIATSRIPLAAANEEVYAVPPLSHSVGNTTGDALDLFLDRAAIGAPGWSVSPDTKAAIADICVRLDGLPLAIELAASWIRVLSPGTCSARSARSRRVCRRSANRLRPGIAACRPCWLARGAGSRRPSVTGLLR